MYFGFWHIVNGFAEHTLPESLPDAQRPVKCFNVALLRAMAKHIGGDGLDAFESGPAAFERQAAVANATAVGCCALACRRTLPNTGRRRTGSKKAFANGTLAPLIGKQAAEGQTARQCDDMRLIRVAPWCADCLQGQAAHSILAGSGVSMNLFATKTKEKGHARRHGQLRTSRKA
jgi:hypothetical protein